MTREVKYKLYKIVKSQNPCCKVQSQSAASMWLLVGLLGTLSILLFIRQKVSSVGKFHVEVEKPKILVNGLNILPLIKIVVGLLPQSLLSNNLVKEVIIFSPKLYFSLTNAREHPSQASNPGTNMTV